MSDEAQDKPVKQAARKPAATPGARPRKSTTPKAAAATTGIAKPARVSVSVVPEIAPAAPGVLSRRASALRLGLLTTTLALLVGGLAWFGGAPESSAPEPTQIAANSPGSSLAADTLALTVAGLGWFSDARESSSPQPAQISASSPISPPPDPLAPHVRQSLEQEHRMAALALDIRQSQESLARLWDDARSLAASVGALASGMEHIKSDVGAARIDASAGLARLEERLHEVKLVAIAGPTLLGDPALQGFIQLGDPQIAHSQSRLAEASEPVQPATTGGLPESVAVPQASVEVSLNKPRPRSRASRPIGGWHVHKVEDDLAVVEGKGSHYEVRAGELLPGAGIVRSIKKRGERWVVLTSKGVIAEPK